MSTKQHHYSGDLNWVGNTGAGTESYTSYSRNHEFSVAGKPVLPGSSDPSFRGDASRYNPEELLLAAISNCHMLWFLHLCAVNNIVVTAYEDHPVATMQEDGRGGGRFTEATLKPVVTIKKGDPARAEELHREAHDLCFIAQSLNFPVQCVGRVVVGEG